MATNERAFYLGRSDLIILPGGWASYKDQALDRYLVLSLRAPEGARLTSLLIRGNERLKRVINGPTPVHFSECLELYGKPYFELFAGDWVEGRIENHSSEPLTFSLCIWGVAS